MPDTKTTDESAASSLSGAELVRIVQSGANARTTTQDIADLGAPAVLSRHYVDVKDYLPAGISLDGTYHPLSTYYANLTAAQVDYPAATATTQTAEYCAIKKASDLAFGATGSENNSNAHLNWPLILPPGIMYLGADTWKVSKCRGAKIVGAGRLSTILTNNGIVFQTDGFWYGQVDGVQFLTSSPPAWQASHVYAALSFVVVLVGNQYRTFVTTAGGTSGGSAPTWTTDGTTHVTDNTVDWFEKPLATCDIDGNAAGAGTTVGVQGNTFKDCLFVASGMGYAFAFTRQGGGSGQGSENLLLNCHFQSGGTACYYAAGLNNLANLMIGGDMQGYRKHGIQLAGATLHVYNTSFESTYGYVQALNGGFDMYMGDSGAYEACEIHGVRTESIRAFYNGGAVHAPVSGVVGNSALSAWAANTTFAATAGIQVTAIDGRKRVFVQTVVGQTGSSQPSWPIDGTTVSDGAATWQEYVFDFIYNVSGGVNLESCAGRGGGKVQKNWSGSNSNQGPITTDWVLREGDTCLDMDATSGNLNVYIPTMATASLSINRQREFAINRIDTSANTITITSLGQRFEGGSTTYVISGSARSYRKFRYQDQVGGTSPPWWYLIESLDK